MSMRKILATALVAVTAIFAQSVEASDPRWGYVYVDESQTVASGDPVDWSLTSSGLAQGVFSEGVYVNPYDPTTLVIKHPGIYAVTYSTTVEVATATDPSNVGDAQFALFLNESLVQGSIYGVGNAYSADFLNAVIDYAFEDADLTLEAQCDGQVIIRVRDHNSLLSLKNHGQNVLYLSAEAGTNGEFNYGNNVAASVAVRRLDKHLDD